MAWDKTITRGEDDFESTRPYEFGERSVLQVLLLVLPRSAHQAIFECTTY